MWLFFVRHGRPKVLNNNFYEAHLSEEGFGMARRMAQSGRFPKPDSVYSSPYKRAEDTAEAMCEVFGVSFEVKDFLKEWNLQSLNLPDPEYAIETQRGWADQSMRVRGGESLSELKRRAYEGTLQVVGASTAETVLFVSHGTLIEMLCAEVGGRQPLETNVEDMAFLAWAVFEFRNGALILRKDVTPN